jgi:hypothetical protein
MAQPAVPSIASASAARSAIDRELRPGERLLWQGGPLTGIRLRPADSFLIPFSLLWGGFAIVWETSVVSGLAQKGPAGFLFVIWGIPFVLLGLYLIFGRFVVDARRRGATMYGLTDQRAIIATGVYTRQVRSIDLRSTPDIAITEKSDRSGTVAFGEQPPAFWGGRRTLPGLEPHPAAFEMIPNVRDVYDLIQNAKRR